MTNQKTKASNAIFCPPIPQLLAGVALALLLGITDGTAASDEAPSGSKEQSRISLTKIPEASTEELGRVLKNLAHWNMGAALILPAKGPKQFTRLEPQKDPNVLQQEHAVLLSDDGSLDYPISENEQTFIVKLNEMHRIDRAHFSSIDAKGRVRIFVSDTLAKLKSRRWKQVSDWVSFGSDDNVDIRFPQIDAQYIRFHFDIQKAGPISSLGVFGDLTVRETTYNPRKDNTAQKSPTANTQTLNFDLASLYTGSRITHVSSSSATGVNNMIDDDLDTGFNFHQNDTNHVFVMDLNSEANVNRVSFLLKSPAGGELEIYLLRVLEGDDEDEESDPAKQNGASKASVGADTTVAQASSNGESAKPAAYVDPEQQKLVIDSDFFERQSARNVKSVSPGKQRIRFRIESIPTRFLLVRWLPFQPEADSIPLADQKNLKTIPSVAKSENGARAEGGTTTAVTDSTATTTAGASAGESGASVAQATTPTTATSAPETSTASTAGGSTAAASSDGGAALTVYDANVIAEVPAEQFFMSQNQISGFQETASAGDVASPSNTQTDDTASSNTETPETETPSTETSSTPEETPSVADGPTNVEETPRINPNSNPP